MVFFNKTKTEKQQIDTAEEDQEKIEEKNS